MKVIRELGKVVFLSDMSTFTRLSRRRDVSLAVLQEFPQRRKKVCTPCWDARRALFSPMEIEPR